MLFFMVEKTGEKQGRRIHVPSTEEDYLSQYVSVLESQVEDLRREIKAYRSQHQDISTQAIRSQLRHKRVDKPDFPENVIWGFVKYSSIILGILFVYKLGEMSAKPSK